jgi:hypothetical protein
MAENGLTLDRGNLAAPAYSFIGDGNTGLYSPGADQVGVVCAGNAAAVFSSAGMSSVKAPVETKAGAYTVTAADSGKVFVATAADVVFTLPATSAGLTYRFVVAASGLSAGTGLSVSPAAVDKIMGNGFTSADDKDAILSGATDREGDCITIVGDGADGWYITGVVGTWARQA